VQLSWDQPLKNELRIVGSKAEAVLRVDQFDRLAIRRAASFQELEVDHRYVADISRSSVPAISPRLYTHSLVCQVIQFVRAIRLGERAAVDGEAGAECVRLIEAARRCAQPLPIPWFDHSEDGAYRTLHWASA